MDTSQQPAAARRRVVMLVDDEKPVTDLLTSLLEEGLGLTTVAFNDPAAALAALTPAAPDTHTSLDPDVVISDLLMPRMNGYEFLRAMARCRPGTPSILVTGSNPHPDVVAANQPPHFLGLLHKPVSWRDIAALLRRHSLLS